MMRGMRRQNGASFKTIAMEITAATASDIPELCVLLAQLFNQEAEFKADSALQSQGLKRIIDDSETGQIIIARQEGRIVGMVNLLYTISTALGSRVALLEDMVVSKQAQGTGIGSELIEKAIQAARQKGCKRITLLTDRDNEAAQGFYRKHGFEFSAMIPMRLSLGE